MQCDNANDLYYRKGILKPQGFTVGKRRVYTEQQRQTLELILLLKDLGCALSDIDMLLKVKVL